MLVLHLGRARDGSTAVHQQTGIPHHRYIRIEYAPRNGSGQDDTRYMNWKVGDKFDVSGPVLGDTDREGFFELHPTRAQDVSIVVK